MKTEELLKEKLCTTYKEKYITENFNPPFQIYMKQS